MYSLVYRAAFRKIASGGRIGTALLEKGGMPTFANWYRNSRNFTNKHLTNALAYEIPGTSRLRLMEQAKARQLAEQLGHSPEALGIFALPGGGVATPLYLKANKALESRLL